MNILYTNYHRGYGGGHTTYIKTLVHNTPFRSFVATPKGSQLYNDLIAREIPVADVKFPSKFKDVIKIIYSAFKLAKLINNWEIDLVHTNENADNRIVFLASLLTKKKFKTVFTKHNDKPIKKRLTSKLRFEYFNSRVIYVADSISKTIGLIPKNVKPVIIPNGVDILAWHQNITPVHSPIHLVSIAGTARCKGIHYLFAAFRKLPIAYQEKFKVTIVGEAPNAAYLNELCLDDLPKLKVNFEGYTKNPKQYLESADVGFVLSDSEETISFACREMMAAGLPVIVSDFGALTQNVDHDQNGWITKKGDAEDIANILKYISCMDQNKFLSFKIAAKDKAEKEFDISIMLKKTYQLYKDIYTN